jgi:hypothetical protein
MCTLLYLMDRPNHLICHLIFCPIFRAALFLLSCNHHVHNMVYDVYSIKELNNTPAVTWQVLESMHGSTSLCHSEM